MSRWPPAPPHGVTHPIQAEGAPARPPVVAFRELRVQRLRAAIAEREAASWPPGFPPGHADQQRQRDDSAWRSRAPADVPAEIQRARREGRAHPRDGGEFRPQLVAKTLRDDIVGVSVLCYQRPADAERFVRSAQRHIKSRHVLLAFDNSEDFRTGDWFLRHAAEVPYVKSASNVGTSIAHNRQVEWLGALGCRYILLADQDVEFLGDPIPAMLEVFHRYPDTGVVGWEQLLRAGNWGRPVAEDGSVCEISGVCSMFRMEAIIAADGWCPEYFLHIGEDTYICCMCGVKGWKTRVIAGDAPMRHVEPHSGVDANPWSSAEWKRSTTLFEYHTKRYGFPMVF